jgi:hypothetical protein
MAGISFMLMTYEFEFMEYTTLDGRPSIRGPQMRPNFAGSGVVPPDGDFRVKITKRW